MHCFEVAHGCTSGVSPSGPVPNSRIQEEPMKKLLSILSLSVVTIVMVLVLSPLAYAADVQGKIKSVDPSGRMVTLDDGTMLTIPPALKIEKQALKPGANVKASYQEKDGQKVATALMVMPAR
jgi:hypothetical protein